MKSTMISAGSCCDSDRDSKVVNTSGGTTKYRSTGENEYQNSIDDNKRLQNGQIQPLVAFDRFVISAKGDPDKCPVVYCVEQSI